jgi:hypothetical protein
MKKSPVLILIPIAAAAIAQASTTPQAVTGNPAEAIGGRVVDSMFQTREEDEAFTSRKEGKFGPAQEKIFMKGADLDYRADRVHGYDYLQDMDYGITRPENRKELAKTLNEFVPGISPDEAARRVARGRINWMIWSGGNDRFWNYMSQATLGGTDLLKTISSYKSADYQTPANRENRWKTLGLVNEPCFEQAKKGRPDRWGLWLDTRKAGCAADPYENEADYPGVRIGARGEPVGPNGEKLDVGSMYGYATGVVGLRLFPNPDFDKEAAKKWDAKAYYETPNYYNDPKLVRPYRVGMACAFCHTGPNPSHEPAKFNAPEWADLNSNPGAQYFWVDRILLWNFAENEKNFVYQLVHTSRPGALDTSLISSDQINNPRTMNAVYDLPSRVKGTMAFGFHEQLSGSELRNAQFNTVNDMRKNPNLVPKQAEVLMDLFNPKDKTVLAPRVLKDGSDSVGALGALNRVYVNIGLFSEDWVQHFIPLVGGPLVSPFKIKTAQKKSLYWQANENQTPDTALFLLAASRPDKLEKALEHTRQAPVTYDFVPESDGPNERIQHGKEVFAVTCARCHSSKLPAKALAFFNNPKNPTMCTGSNYLTGCWDPYWKYTTSDEFKEQMKAIVLDENFLKDNFLSNDQRVPVNLLDSQLCSPVATNGIAGNIWNDFTSTTYKSMPGVGSFLSAEPSLNEYDTVATPTSVPAGGRGYLRPASLISIWSTAPFLTNNSLGLFDDRGTVEGRMRSFDDSILRLLWPEHRNTVPADELSADGGKKIVSYMPGTYDYVESMTHRKIPESQKHKLYGIMDVTTTDSYLNIPKGYVESVWPLLPKELKASSPELGDHLQLGPIPKGVPVDLVSNLDTEHPIKLLEAAVALGEAVAKIKERHLEGTEQAREVFMQIAMKRMLNDSKCNDFVVTRGHYFGTEWAPDVIAGDAKPLTAEDKDALIGYLKQM